MTRDEDLTDEDFDRMAENLKRGRNIMATRDETLAQIEGVKARIKDVLQAKVDAHENWIKLFRDHERALASLVASQPHFEASGDKEFEWRLSAVWFADPRLVAITEALDAAVTHMKRIDAEEQGLAVDLTTLIASLEHRWLIGTP